MDNLNNLDKREWFIIDEFDPQKKEFHKKNFDGSKKDVYYNADGSTHILTDTLGMSLETRKDSYGRVITEEKVNEFGKKTIHFNLK